MRRLTILLFLCSCGLLGRPAEEQKKLTSHQYNAKLYFDNKQYSQALEQIAKGLAVDPDDYQLTLIKTHILLIQAQQTNDPIKLRDALAAYDRLASLRAVDKLEPQTLLVYSWLQQRLGMEQAAQAERIRDELKRASWTEIERKERLGKLEVYQNKAEQHLSNAERQLLGLIKRGDEPMLAEYHLMQLLALRERFPEAIEHGKAWLVLAEKQQTQQKAQIDKTYTPGWENYVKGEQKSLIDTELEVRALLANMHYKLGQHQEVVAELDHVLAIDPTRSIDYFNRGRSLKELKRNEEMRRDFQKFLATTKLPPGSTQVTDAYTSLKER